MRKKEIWTAKITYEKELEIYLLSSHYPAQDFQMVTPFYCLNHSIVFSQFKPFKCIFTIYTIWSNHLEALGHPLKNKKNQKTIVFLPVRQIYFHSHMF